MSDEEVDSKMDMGVALPIVLKDARVYDSLARGLREVCKAIESGKALFVVLANSCDDAKYKNCVEALCKDVECPTPIMTTDSATELGTWCGLVRTDAGGNPVKITKCSSCAVLRNVPDDLQQATAWGVVLTSLGIENKNVVE